MSWPGALCGMAGIGAGLAMMWGLHPGYAFPIALVAILGMAVFR